MQAQRLFWALVKVQHGGALVEAMCMPRVAKPDLLLVEVVAQLMAERAQDNVNRQIQNHTFWTNSRTNPCVRESCGIPGRRQEIP